MSETMQWQDQLLSTKFFVPASPHPLIARPRLTALLDEGLQHKLTLLSAPAVFGKTTLVSTWVRSRPEEDAPVAWVSLGESDNDPARFWSYLLTALDGSYPGLGQQALTHLRAPQVPPIQFILTTLINTMTTRAAPYLLILDDYHVITEPAIHDAFRFLLEHQPAHLHVFLLTRVDPPFLLGRLRALGQILELRIDQLRFTSQEAATFLTQAMGLSLEAEAVQAVETRTEGWSASLQLAALSIQRQTDVADLLTRLRGDNRYILDYLTDEALRQAAEAALLASPSPPASRSDHPNQKAESTENDTAFLPKDHERDRLFGEILALRGLIAGNYGDSKVALNLCQRAMTHLSEQDHYEHALVAYARALAFFAVGQAKAATQSALESSAFYQVAGMMASTISYIGMVTVGLHMQGQLHAARRMCQSAIQLGNEVGNQTDAAVGLIYVQQADVLREWNQLDEALELALRGLQFSRQP